MRSIIFAAFFTAVITVVVGPQPHSYFYSSHTSCTNGNCKVQHSSSSSSSMPSWFSSPLMSSLPSISSWSFGNKPSSSSHGHKPSSLDAWQGVNPGSAEIMPGTYPGTQSQYRPPAAVPDPTSDASKGYKKDSVTVEGEKVPLLILGA